MTRLLVVDAFTDEPYRGNPAAVAVLDRFPADSWMQAVAREMNLSETAFVVPRPDGDHDLRWMTPQAEVDLCGHATLATAHVLGGAGRFHTRSGLLTCRSGPGGTIEMDFPADPPTELPSGPLPGIDAVRWGRGRATLLAELADEEAVRSYQPDLAAIAALDTRGLIVTAPSAGTADFVSRYFAPAAGIPEDPVTGSAHCLLAGWWSDRFGRPDLVGYQASARGGTVHVRVEGDRVTLAGRAVTVSEVRLMAEPPQS